MSTTPGWYHGEGDPPGSTRYWDGTRWVGDPVAAPADVVGPGGRQLASPGRRVGARAIDLVILVIITLVFLFPAISDMIDGIDALPPGASDDEVTQVVEDAFSDRGTNLLLAGVVGFAWEWLFVAFVGGTPGKLMVRIRITDRETGTSPPSIGQAAMRAANRLFGLLAAVSAALGNVATGVLALIGLASFIMLFVDDQHRTVMDHIGKTVVRVK